MVISEQDRARVANAVAEAEKRTDAEIVPVVAVASGRYDRAEDLFGVWLAAIAVPLVWCALPAPDDAGSWGGWPAWASVAGLVLAVVVPFLLGAVIAARVGWLRRLCTPAREMREEVEARARQVFFDRRAHHTARASGLVLYLSLQERMAVVLGDATVVEKAGQPTLETLRDRLVAEVKTGGPVDALVATIDAAADALEPVLPAADGGADELPNALVVLPAP